MIKAWLQRDGKTFLKYAVVGVSGTIIDVAGFTALISLTSLNRFVAASMSFVAAVINNYSWNRIWTFQDHVHEIKKQFPKFFAVSVVGLLLNLFFLWLIALIIASLFTAIGFIPSVEAMPTWGQTLAKLGASACVLTYNFLANRYWTFKQS